MTPELEQLHRSVSEIPCPRCEAPIDARCVNPVTGQRSRVPCVDRVRALGETSWPETIPQEFPDIAPAQSLDTSGDRWLHNHLTTRPQTVARLATELDASTGTIETALARLEWSGYAKCDADGWSLPRNEAAA